MRILLILAISGLSILSCHSTSDAAITLVSGDPDPSFPDLKVWYDAGSIAGVDGSPVSTWNSSASAANSATMGDAAKRPTLVTTGVNGLPAVTFDGINDQLTMATNLFSTVGNPLTYFAVLQTIDTSAHVIGTGSSGSPYLSSFGGALVIDGSATLKANFNSNGTYLQATTTDYSSGALITAAATDNASTIAIDSVIESVDGTNLVNPYPYYPKATLGSSDGSASGQSQDPFSGSISEILIYGSLTASETDQVNTYLSNKYFNTTSIPEPSSLAFLSIGALGIAGCRRK